MTATVEIDLTVTASTALAVQGHPPAETRTRWLPLSVTEIRTAGTWSRLTAERADSLRGQTARLRIPRQTAAEKHLLHPAPETPRLI